MSGQIKVEELPLEQHEDWQRSRSLYIWDPPAGLKQRLPSWYQIGLECCTDMKGNRIFSPIPLTFDGSSLREKVLRSRADATAYAWIAALGGRAICESKNESQQPLLSLDIAEFYQRYIRSRKEFLGETRELKRSFRACGADRAEYDDGHALTGRLGLGPNCAGRGWSSAEINDVGVRSAREGGISNPTPDQIYWRALFEAARSNPLRLNVAEVESIARQSLFAIAPGRGAVTHDQLQYIADIVATSLREVCSLPEDETAKWICDRKSNLLHRISKRRDLPMPKEQVKQVMLELGWKSFRLLADCVDTQMRAIRDAMSTPLNRFEADRYERNFLNNSSFCVPLIILHDRLDVLKDAIINYWNNRDDPDAVAVVQTMMYYFSVLVEYERSEDRRLKQQRGKKDHRVSVIKSHADAERAAASLTRTSDTLQEAAQFVFRELGYLRGLDYADIEIQNQGCWDDDPLELRVICLAPSIDKTVAIPLAQFIDIANRFRSELQ
jgi:hypothetical protein